MDLLKIIPSYYTKNKYDTFTNNYKQYVPGFVNLCDDKKLKEILNIHLKCNETCIDVATEEVCKFIKNVCSAI